MDFFDFENQPTESFSAEKEVTDYLRSGYELEILNQFPNLKKMYMKYNSPTPSSAPVERLFSLGGLMLDASSQRSQLFFSQTFNPSKDLHITGFGYPVRMDRSPLIANKSRGGGVCIYINERYCNIVVVREKICTQDLELLSISLRGTRTIV